METLNGIVVKITERTFSDVQGSGGGSTSLGSIAPIKIQTSHHLTRMVWVKTTRAGDVELDISEIPVAVLEGHKMRAVIDESGLIYFRNISTSDEWVDPSLKAKFIHVPTPIKWGKVDALLRYLIGAPVGLAVMLLAASLGLAQIESYFPETVSFFDKFFSSFIGVPVVIIYAIFSLSLGAYVAERFCRPKSGALNQNAVDAASQAKAQHEARLKAFQAAIQEMG